MKDSVIGGCESKKLESSQVVQVVFLNVSFPQEPYETVVFLRFMWAAAESRFDLCTSQS